MHAFPHVEFTNDFLLSLIDNDLEEIEN